MQATLLPPEVLEATLRVGVVGAADHVQVQVEVVDPGSGELLAMWSRPSASYSAVEDVLASATRELLKMLAELTSPF